MIYGVTGLLGGGKSYGSVRDAVIHISRGGVVATNIELNCSEIAKIIRRPLEYVKTRVYNIDPDENRNPWEWPRGDSRGQGTRRVLIIIDEAGEWFSSFESRQGIQDFCAWLRQSDKRGQDVYLIVQDSSILAKQGRVLVHRWLYMRNMEQWRIPKLGWPLPPPWNKEFHRLEYSTATGKSSPQEIGKDIHYRDKRIYKVYQTSAMFGASAKSAPGKNPYDSAVDYTPPKKDSPLWLIVLPFVVPFVYLLVS